LDILEYGSGHTSEVAGEASKESVLASEVLPAGGKDPVSGTLTLRPSHQVGVRDIGPDDPLYRLIQEAEAFIKKSKAPNTQRAYGSDWRHFVAWCQKHALPSLPAEPQTVALYITYLAKPDAGEKPRKAATITRRLTAINNAHKLAGFDLPATMNHRLVWATFHGIRRDIGTVQKMKKPLTRDRIVKVLGALEGPIAASRDKALVLIGFATSFRRSELVAIQYSDVTWHKKGATIRLSRSKTDQEGAGREAEIRWGVSDQTCPVLALEDWLKLSGIREGPVFRKVSQYGTIGRKALHPNSVGRLVQELVTDAGISSPKEYGGHSLRAGFVTEASANGATYEQIMKQTGHKTTAMVRRYSRADQKDRQEAGSKLRL